MKIYNNWFLFSMALILSIAAMLYGFSMGQQSSFDNCQRFGMFHYSGKVYSCQQVGEGDVVVRDFKEAGK